ncbi:AraC family transcriptional regulator [Cognatiyoonia sp. IB215182]|uniref:AraC family transcriptional regulator n=1 Tax=Cognatiyoonia sp. IB215182 TaxID=3097353 RepID=UPI002A113D2E|nr:AraC family transcriptional regulator [Cognatiyoonia sp. IB215182]MDX8350859.1 AraC family transcriptional regulator [Cognatiyoonia sp. IB215182]
MLGDLKGAVADAFTAEGLDDGLLHPAAGLVLVKHARRSDWMDTVYEPNLCIVLNGAKDTRVGDDVFQIEAGQALIVSHHLPVASQVVKATPEDPYLAVVLKLDVPTLHNFANRIDKNGFGNDGAVSFAVEEVTEDLVEAIQRYIASTEDKAAAEILGPAQFQELHFRLLKSSQGGMLRELIAQTSHASRIARAIDVINANFATPLSMSALASQAGMSESAFYQHFKAVTRMTPLQYQKQMRMHEAQRILTSGVATVTEVAFKVGYESLSQFSREYSRKFGVSPKAMKQVAV